MVLHLHRPNFNAGTGGRQAGSRRFRRGIEISIPEQIRKLAELRDAAIISDEEFQAKKSELLQRM